MIGDFNIMVIKLLNIVQRINKVRILYLLIPIKTSNNNRIIENSKVINLKTKFSYFTINNTLKFCMFDFTQIAFLNKQLHSINKPYAFFIIMKTKCYILDNEFVIEFSIRLSGIEVFQNQCLHSRINHTNLITKYKIYSS